MHRLPSGEILRCQWSQQLHALDAGKYSTSLGASSSTVCTICNFGTYSGAGATECKLCPAGTYNQDESTSADEHDSVNDCEDCADGMLSTPNRYNCRACSSGEYSHNKTECVSCERGRYAPVAMTSSCISCAAGSSTDGVLRRQRRAPRVTPAGEPNLSQ